MVGPEFDPLQRLREEAQQLGGALAEFDTTVNNKVAELYPQFLEGKSGGEFLESAVLLGEAVRDRVSSRPLLEAQKRHLEWAIQIGELAEQGFYGERGEEIFGRAQEALRESGILFEESPVQPPQPSQSEFSAQQSLNEVELRDKIELRICPVEEGQEDKVTVYSISRDQIEEDPKLVSPKGGGIYVIGRKREVINLVRLIPNGMSVFKSSITETLGISASNVDTVVSQVRILLKSAEFDHTIENLSKLGSEARYYWEEVRKKVGEEMADTQGGELSQGDKSLTESDHEGNDDLRVQPTSGNGEVAGIGEETETGGEVSAAAEVEAIANAQTADVTAVERMLEDEEAVKKIEELLEQNLIFLERRGSGAVDTLLSRLPIVEEDELEALSKYDREEIETRLWHLPKNSSPVDFSKIPARVIEHLHFVSAFWVGRLENFNSGIPNINYDHLRECIRNYLHMEQLYTRAYPEIENLPLLVIDLAQRVREQVSEKKSGTYS